MSLRIVTRTHLDPSETAAVADLVTAATDRDGTAPVSEHVRLHLRHGGDPKSLDLLAFRIEPDGGGRLVGYAHLDLADRERGPAAELAVHPDARRAGVAGALLARLEEAVDAADAAGGGRLRLWAHGRHPGAAELARSRGYVLERELLRMRRPLDATLPEPELPEGVRIRPFEVGRDEEPWLRVNNRAFAQHPEQGGWDVEQVRMREREPWFDPEGFLLAERVADGEGGELVGFHWTKVHGGAEPVGEVYVVGVDPSAQGLGLGRSLTLAGLHHLRSRGLSCVMLYVDGSNAPAIAVYRRLGFTEWDVDVQFARQPPDARASA